MVYIMVTTWYPPGKSSEVAKLYLELRKKSLLDKSLGTRIVPMAVSNVKEGLRSIVIYEAKKDKGEELLAWVAKTMLEFAKIEGYQYQVEVLLSGAEALPLIGMKMPE